ncbi:hypothetical protein EMIT0P176_300027 [Pseudomonas sp. IT-P176]
MTKKRSKIERQQCLQVSVSSCESFVKLWMRILSYRTFFSETALHPVEAGQGACCSFHDNRMLK